MKKFKRVYIEFDELTQTYRIRISKVTQSNEFGKYEDIDEEEIKCFGGYETFEEALKDAKEEKAKEIILIDIEME